MSSRRPRRPRRLDPAEQARKLRNNAAMRRVYESAVRQREHAPVFVCGGFNCPCNDFLPCPDPGCGAA